MSANSPINPHAVKPIEPPDPSDTHHADSVLFEFRELYRAPANPDVAPRHADPEDIVLYAMQFLSGEQAYVIAHHMERCAECHREFALVQGDLAACAFSVELQSPSAPARQRLMAQIIRERKAIPKPAPRIAPKVAAGGDEKAGSEADSAVQPTLAAYGRRGSILTTHDDEEEEKESLRPRRKLALTLLGWAGWIVAACLAVASARVYRADEAVRADLSTERGNFARLATDTTTSHQLMGALTDPDAVHLILSAQPSTKAQPTARVTYNPRNGNLIFLADDLDPLQMYKVYELWLFPADGRAPIPAAVFHPDGHGSASVILPTVPKGIAAKQFGVTVEDDGGAQTPTSPIVLAGS